MSGPPACLVTKSSATRCRPWEDGPEHICPISRSHSDMVKFREHDEEYDKVAQRLSGLARRAVERGIRHRSNTGPELSGKSPKPAAVQEEGGLNTFCE